MKNNLLFIFFLLASLACRAQLAAIPGERVGVNYHKTTHLVFPA